MTGVVPAVLWDMDGTLIDSEPVWIECQAALARRFGVGWTESDGLALVGADLPTTADALRSAGVRLGRAAIIDELEAAVLARLRESVLWRAGALELLAALRASGHPCAIVTTSSLEMANAVAGAAPAGSFDLLVTAGSTAAPKPAPDPYLHAAALLGVPIADCVAIEDSWTGLRAAEASGAVCIAVPSASPLPAPRRGALWSGLEGRAVQELVELWIECTSFRGSLDDEQRVRRG